MPAVPHQATSSQPPLTKPPNPDIPTHLDISSSSITKSPSHQPSPGIINTLSHKSLHAIPRRFLGPLPSDQSSLVIAKQGKLKRARRKAIDRLNLSNGSNQSGLGEGERGKVVRSLGRVKVWRKMGGKRVLTEIEIEDSGWDTTGYDQTAFNWDVGKGVSMGKGKEKWVGEGFDIGREFFLSGQMSTRSNEETRSNESITSSSLRTGGVMDTSPDCPLESPVAERDAESMVDENGAGPSDYSGLNPRKRPNLTPKSTQESFVTARTELSTSLSQSPFSSNIHLPRPTSDPEIGESPAQSNRNLEEHDQDRLIASGASSSSARHLIGEGEKDRLRDNASSLGSLGKNHLKRLKSAIRKPSTTATLPHLEARGVNDEFGNVKRDRNFRSKSVSFPMDPVDLVDGEIVPLDAAGDKPPLNPESVLAREGDQAQGTSAGAQAAALDEVDEDSDEVALRTGDVQLRDRMLVKVGYHRDDGVTIFDEEKQRRSPCTRMEPFEEYIVVLRKSRIELYQDYRDPIRARLRGYLRLCFVIILLPSYTSLSVFNPVDMTISLTTSVSKLSRELDAPLQRTNTKRTQALKQRVKESKQAQWIQKSKRGTHVFILKLGERSRANDWYWKIWRELDGELPPKFDISASALSTSIRIKIPEDRFDTGGCTTQKELTVDKIVKSCWDMMREVVDVEDLQRQSGKGHDDLDLQLAWKSEDGALEWIAYDTTVEGLRRNWAVLAGVAKLPSERIPRILQLRSARHGPSLMKLDTGTVLEEPPAVEGYLIRHRSGKIPKEQVYVASHDGVIYVSSLGKARPPLPPHKEGSYPYDVFPELYEEFAKSEKRRMARFIERSTGCVDIRDFQSVQMCEDSESGSVVALSKKKQIISFIVTLPHGETIFEAASPEVAKEWVDRLNSLIEYWKRKHRVDARIRMDAMEMHNHKDPFAGTRLSNASDDILSDIWDWCAIKGCRGVCMSGRLYFKKKPLDKFKARYIVLTGGSLVTFKVKTTQSFYPRQHHYPLFGAYVYSGMLAQEELPEIRDENALGQRARVYQDGLQSHDGAEDTTFCVRLVRGKSGFIRKKEYPWEMEDEDEDEGDDLGSKVDSSTKSVKTGHTLKSRKGDKSVKSSRFFVPSLSTQPPQLLVFRARSKLERDRWVWAINAEMERQVRANQEAEAGLRYYGKVP